MSTQKINFTKNTLDNLPNANTNSRDVYKDISCSQLELRVTTTGVKTFSVLNFLNGKLIRTTLGKYPNMTIQQARQQAVEVIHQMNQGINPNSIKDKKRHELTLKELCSEFMENYCKIYNKTYQEYQRDFDRFLGKWYKKRLSEITKKDITELFAQATTNNGHYEANRLLAKISCLFNKGIEWEYCDFNPAKGIKKNKEQSRDRFLQNYEISIIAEGLTKMPEYFRVFVLLCLYTGARRGNIFAMRWDQIDFEMKIWNIPKTKNKQPIIIPLVDQAIELLTILYNSDTYPKSEWLLPSKTSACGHITDIKKSWAIFKKITGLTNLRIHDLRRTNASWQAITGSPIQTICKSLGHSSINTTQIYARLNQESIRQSMQNAIDYFCEHV